MHTMSRSHGNWDPHRGTYSGNRRRGGRTSNKQTSKNKKGRDGAQRVGTKTSSPQQFNEARVIRHGGHRGAYRYRPPQNYGGGGIQTKQRRAMGYETQRAPMPYSTGQYYQPHFIQPAPTQATPTVPPGLGYPGWNGYPYGYPSPIPAGEEPFRHTYHGDDDRYVASNNCVLFQRGRCSKGANCEWRHYNADTHQVERTLYDPAAGGPGFQARQQHQQPSDGQVSGKARLLGESKQDEPVFSLANQLVDGSGDVVRTVSQNDPTCWEFNSLKGCRRMSGCRYDHIYLPYKFYHPYTGQIVDPQEAKRAAAQRMKALSRPPARPSYVEIHRDDRKVPDDQDDHKPRTLTHDTSPPQPPPENVNGSRATEE